MFYFKVTYFDVRNTPDSRLYNLFVCTPFESGEVVLTAVIRLHDHPKHRVMVRLSRHARGGGRAAGNASGSSLGQRSARMKVGISRYPGDERCATNVNHSRWK